MRHIGSLSLVLVAFFFVLSAHGQGSSPPSELRATGPNKTAPEASMDWQKLIGEWEVVVERIGPSGSVINRSEGSWDFFWIMDGHAVQDVFHLKNDYGEDFRFVGLRIFNGANNQWEQVTIDNFERAPELAKGTSSQEKIMFNYTHASGAELRSTYYNITGDSFEWKQEKLDKHTGTWNRGMHVIAKRR